MTGTVRVAVPRISAKQNATDQYQGTLCERKMCVQTFLLFFPNSWTALNLVHKNKIKEKRKRDTNFTIKHNVVTRHVNYARSSRESPLIYTRTTNSRPVSFLKFPPTSTIIPRVIIVSKLISSNIWTRIFEYAYVYIYIYIYLFKILESGRTGRKKNREEERAFLNEWIATSDLFRV